MNPNKKILNPKNNNSPWLLCPSKSFPGKFYYFNGSTGETAWCLSETDKNLKKGTIQKVTDKTHPYPEPYDPPIDDSTNTTNSFTPLNNTTNSFTPLNNAGNTVFSNARETRPTQVFGQAVFPKCVSSDTFSPNFVWALTPMYVPSQLPHRQMLDQVTQTNQPIFLPKHYQPLKTFAPGFQFQNELQYKHRPMFDQTAKFNCFNSSKEVQTLAKRPMKDEACQTFVPTRAKRLRTQSESDPTPKSALKASRSVENLTTLFTKDAETSTVSPPHKVDNETGKLSELDQNDLRFKLVAKRRKEECATETEKTADQSTSKSREVLTPRKRVTFDIQESASDSSDDVEETDQSLESSRMDEQSQPASDGPWYVVADTTALLEDWQCIEEFVKTDSRCRLLVPHAVYTELEGCCRGKWGGLAARQLIRKLAVHASHIVVQSKPEYELSSEDSILQCCWTLLQENIHVVFISNSATMLNKAKSIYLECYNLDAIKDYNITAESQSDFETPNIIEENDENKSKNLFMQDLSEVSGLCLPKPNGFRVCESRKNISETGTDACSQFSKRDANSDKLIDLTRRRVNTVFNSEISNVKDQITKLSIAGNISVNNRSAQIMKNVFSITVPNNKTDQGTTTVDIENHNCNENPTDKNNSDMNNQNVPRRLESIDEIDRDISRLNVTENDVEKSRNATKFNGITKLNKQFNLDEDLERFYIKNAVVENRVKSRLDEWVCRLNQTMEEVLTEILLEKRNNIKRMMPPWNLFEAIQVTGETFKNQPFLKSIVDRFSITLLECSTYIGKLNKDMKPNDLMKLVGLSMILIDHLKEIVNSKELYEAEDMLVALIKNIEDPESDIDLPLPKVTPIFGISEISVVQTPVGYKKTRKEIEEYLKKHFTAWQTPDNLTNAAKDATINIATNIVTTCGKDLNTLKINNTKAITVENKEHDKADVANQPKVIRNVKIIPAFEERVKNKDVLDMDQLDYEESDGNDKTNHLSNAFILDDLSVSATSVNTVCAKAYPFVKMFLVTLKGTLIKLFDFIQTSLQEYHKGMSMNKKADTLMKTELARQYVPKVSERLKNIIARESSDGTTLKDLLIKTGHKVEEGDLFITKYRETVAKFLEQIQLLEKALDHMLSLLNPASAEAKDDSYSDTLNTSPILPSRRLQSNAVQLINGDKT